MPDPRCKKFFATLSNYLDGELAAKDCRELERHFKGCKPCLAYLESLKTTIRSCRQLRVAKIPRPSAQVRKLLLAAAHKSRELA